MYAAEHTRGILDRHNDPGLILFMLVTRHLQKVSQELLFSHMATSAAC